MARIPAIGLVAALLGCTSPPDESPKDSAAAADSSLGRFAGTLPCADCAGIRTELRLFASRQSGQPTRYEATETYVATRDGDRTFERSGRWTMLRGTPDDPDATVYQLDFDQPQAVRNFLKVGDGELRLLDHEQRDIESLTPHSLHRVPDANAPAVTVGEADAGRTIELERGQSIAVLLPSNRSTGFRWSLAPASAGVLTTAGDASYTQDSSGAVGAPGVETWTFRASQRGRQELRFEYRRPWEKTVPPSRVIAFTIAVR
jgi:predicted secreted protein